MYVEDSQSNKKLKESTSHHGVASEESLLEQENGDGCIEF